MSLLTQLGTSIIGAGLAPKPVEAPEPVKLETEGIDSTFLYLSIAVGVLMMGAGFYLVFKK